VLLLVLLLQLLLLLLQEDLAPIQRLLTDELMTIIFSHLGPYTLGQAACVCRQWRYLTDVSEQHGSVRTAAAAVAAAEAVATCPCVPQAPLAT
jgi:hypothetical protein